MKNKELRRLRKIDLFEIIYQQMNEIDKLKKKQEELNRKLVDRTIKIKEAGSIADASIKINQIFEAAQKVADEYIENVKKQYSNDIKQTDEKEEKNDKILDISKIQNNQLIILNNDLSVIKEKFIKRILKKLKEYCINANKKIKNKINNIKERIKIFLIKFNKDKKELLVSRLKKPKSVVEKQQTTKEKNAKGKTDEKNKIRIAAKDYKVSKEDVKKELHRRKKLYEKTKLINTMFFSIIVIIAIAIILASKVFYILQVSGNSMEPTLNNGDLLLTSKLFNYKKGDIIAFYYNDNILIKRLIATEGDIVNIDDEGNIYVNNQKLDEKYIDELSYEDCDITLPYQVPNGTLFVLGDNRKNSIDSRNKSLGVINVDRIIGKIQMRFNNFSIL